MPTRLNDVEYLTTQEAMKLVDMCRSTYEKYVKQYGFQPVQRPGKRRTNLWKKSDVEELLKPIEVKHDRF